MRSAAERQSSNRRLPSAGEGRAARPPTSDTSTTKCALPSSRPRNTGSASAPSASNSSRVEPRQRRGRFLRAHQHVQVVHGQKEAIGLAGAVGEPSLVAAFGLATVQRVTRENVWSHMHLSEVG